jgi:epsilon-lactone hydrolase
VVSVLLTLKQRGLPQPGGAMAFCPWVDLALTLGEHEHSRKAAAAYLAGHPADDPVVSPLGADLSGLPPLLIQAATGDERFPDAQALTDRARRHGVDARLELYPVDAHVFHLFWSFLPEAAEALEAAGRFARGLGSAEEAATA